MLTCGSKLEEILWNFARYPSNSGKRLTLAENPHFYNHKSLPIMPNAYQDGFTTGPMIDDYQHADTFYVLTNKPGRVFLEFGRNSRAFDNVWHANGILIFKSRCLVFLLFSSPLLTSSKVSVESSRMKVQFENPFKAWPVSGCLCLLSLRFGHLYTTGER